MQRNDFRSYRVMFLMQPDRGSCCFIVLCFLCNQIAAAAVFAAMVLSCYVSYATRSRQLLFSLLWVALALANGRVLEAPPGDGGSALPEWVLEHPPSGSFLEELTKSDDPRTNLDVVSVNMTKQFYTYICIQGEWRGGGLRCRAPLQTCPNFTRKSSYAFFEMSNPTWIFGTSSTFQFTKFLSNFLLFDLNLAWKFM